MVAGAADASSIRDGVKTLYWTTCPSNFPVATKLVRPLNLARLQYLVSETEKHYSIITCNARSIVTERVPVVVLDTKVCGAAMF